MLEAVSDGTIGAGSYRRAAQPTNNKAANSRRKNLAVFIRISLHTKKIHAGIFSPS
jgi:hypothetical protein